jgi:hypothetical protein
MAEVKTVLERIQLEHTVLDGPVTNRGLLLATSYLGKIIRCAGKKGAYDSESMVSVWANLQNDLVAEMDVETDAESLQRLARPASQDSSGDAAAQRK